MKPRTAAAGVSNVAIPALANVRRASAAAPSPSQLVISGFAERLARHVMTARCAISVLDASAVGQLIASTASQPSSASTACSASA